MSIESALEYIRRMRGDREFNEQVQALAEDEDASWAFIQAQGYRFDMDDFRHAQEETYKEYGVTPM